ncbi:cache domain-containing protein [Desulforamulus aquiferis]|uniref:Cache domain-containing protein n=1 Tax=Desulforamulus aquiferis TaxID=1397668 RepID=A0AAW7ZDC8_9FIRM|nr:cache domain-containing protein [Desulforamulus aquiferis]MDO7787759.1 cache domain-containing protein [Desulforamulus aquiferis]RYD03120.1 hypothetical protein N752_21225 [Desulforamulus aquiferis]
MQSLKHQITVLVVASTLILAVSIMVAIGMQIKDTAVLACITKAKSDLSTGEALINFKYPGPWREEDGFLYKGNIRINNNNEIVDYISSLTGNTSTIFLGKTRVATTVKKENGERAVGTHASEEVAKKVLTEGKEYLGEAEVVGQRYQTAYKPLLDQNGNIIGMFYVGISKKFYDTLFVDSLTRMALIGIALTIMVFFGAIYFTKRVITEPLKLLTEETQKFTKGDFCSLYYPTKIDSNNEIGELARSIKEMGEWVQALNYQINKATQINAPVAKQIASGADSSFLEEECSNCIKRNVNREKQWGELSKGLNEVTLNQILNYMKEKDCSLSASEIARAVKLTKVTVRRYLDFMERCGKVNVDMQYGPVGRPLKLYRLDIEQ